MNGPDHNRPSEPPSAGAQSGTPGVGQPRRPRIEVLGAAPVAAPGSGPAQNDTCIHAAGAAAPEVWPAETSSMAPNQPQQTETSSGRRRAGLFRSPTMLLMLLASIVIAGSLLYTYVSSQREIPYVEERTELSSEDAELFGLPDPNADSARSQEPTPPSTVSSIDDRVAPEPAPAAPSARQPEPRQVAESESEEAAVAEIPEEPSAAETMAPRDNPGASATVRAFYSALSAGDGASAAQFVVPAKRQSGPLSADALSRYYSSFRRPLRVRSVIPLDADTVGVTYDYVLADGRVCRGRSAVNVVQRDGRSLVSSIRTNGPC